MSVHDEGGECGRIVGSKEMGDGPLLHPLNIFPQQYGQQQPLPQPLLYTQPPMQQQQAPTALPFQAGQPPPWPRPPSRLGLLPTGQFLLHI